MENSIRINLILSELTEVWRLKPTLRLCQLIRLAADNCCPQKGKCRYWESGDLHYLEDAQLLKGLKNIK